MGRWGYVAATVGACVLGVGCVQWFPGKVANGVARLTVRNVGAITTLISQDATCGFENESVKKTFVTEGTVGDRGRVIWHVENCLIDLQTTTEVQTDCQGNITGARGKVTVTADKILEGRLTGDPAAPVLPESPYALTIELRRAEFDTFHVEKSNNDNKLTMRKGAISATVKPKLAVAVSSGLCAQATPHVTFENIAYDRAVVRVDTPDREFDADVDSSAMTAQNGVDGDLENALSGTLTVWGNLEKVPNDGDGLDPEYDATTFVDAFTCRDDLQVPVSHSCDLTPKLGVGAAQLSMRTMASVVIAASMDTTCGFESRKAYDTVVTQGLVGKDGGTATFSISNCLLNFPQATVLKTDCLGVDLIVEGKAVVSGTKTVAGILTGDPASPIVPTSREPAVVTLNAELNNWRAQKSNSIKSLKILSGGLSGSFTPRTALDTTSGACSISTPVMRFSWIEWDDATAKLIAGDKQFDMVLGHSNLEALNGRTETLENWLDGAIEVDGLGVSIPEGTPLDPDYNAAVFMDSFTCDPKLKIPESNAECNFESVLADATARLLIKTFGMVVKAVDLDNTCGFSSIGGMIPSAIAPIEDGEVSASWYVEKCQIANNAEPELFHTDCLGTQTYFDGEAFVTATKTVEGELALGNPPLVPQHRRAARFDIHEVNLAAFAVMQYPAGSTSPSPYLEIHSAKMYGVYLPVTGEAADTPGAYFIKIPVGEFDGVMVENAVATLHVGAKQFSVNIGNATLDGFTGSYQYQSNSLAGMLALEGKRFDVPTSSGLLDPFFNQATFDASYACIDNLMEPIPTDAYLSTAP